MFGFETYLVSTTIALQASVAFISVIRAKNSISKHKITWSILSLVFFLMTIVRGASLLVSLGFFVPVYFPEILSFSISLLLCISVYNVGKILPALENVVTGIPGASEEIKKIARDISLEIESDKEELELYLSNGDSLSKSKGELIEATKKLVTIAHNLEKMTNDSRQ